MSTEWEKHQERTGSRASESVPIRKRRLGLAATLAWLVLASVAHAQYLRIVNYNIEADVPGYTTPRTGLYTVLEAIGEQSFVGVQQPIDILALEETTSIPATVTPIASALNAYYKTNNYVVANLQALQQGSPTQGNGPNALIFNQSTLQLQAQTVVSGTPNSTGVNRQVIRYQFHALASPAATSFYLYVSHMKSSSSGSSATDQSDRNAEATLIRKDEALLAAGSSAVYVGDFNMDGSFEAAYQTLTSTAVNQPTGAGVDALNSPQNNSETWNSAFYQAILTESAVAIKYRDDIQFMTADIYGGTPSAALRYVPGSMRAFGNSGTTAYGQSANQSTNTALTGLTGPVTGPTALGALTTASDHLPEVADYVATTPYNTWQVENFTPPELGNGAISGDLADPDGDGIANLLEYALNLDPRVAGATGLPVSGQATVGGSQYLTLTYTQVIAATGITYVPQVSGDLSTWNGGSGYTVPVSATNNRDGVTQTVVVRDAVAMTAGGRRFMRLQVSRP